MSFYLVNSFFILSCASHRYDIHKTPDLRGNQLERTYVERDGNYVENIFYNKAVLVDDVFIDERHFAERMDGKFEDGYRLFEHGSLIDSMASGNEQYLFIFRNYVGECCDGLSAGSFQILINLIDGRPNLAKSIVYEDGHFQLPHSAWFPRTIHLEKDSLRIRSGNRSTGDSLELKTKVEIDSKFTIAEFKADYHKIEGSVKN